MSGRRGNGEPQNAVEPLTRLLRRSQHPRRPTRRAALWNCCRKVREGTEERRRRGKRVGKQAAGGLVRVSLPQIISLFQCGNLRTRSHQRERERDPNAARPFHTYVCCFFQAHQQQRRGEGAPAFSGRRGGRDVGRFYAHRRRLPIAFTVDLCWRRLLP